MGKKFTFSGKIRADRERRKSSKSFIPDYLSIGDIPLFVIRPNKDLKDEEDVVEVLLDILPYPVTDPNHMDRDEENELAIDGKWWFKKPYRLHRNIGIQDEYVVCPTTWDRRAHCPICLYRTAQEKAGVPYDKLTDFSWAARSLYVVIPREVTTTRKDVEFEEKIHIWDVSQNIFQKKLDKELELKPQFDTYADLEGGFSLLLRFGKKPGGNFKYMDIDRIDFVERPKDIPESILDEVPELDECLVKLPIEEIAQKFESDPFLNKEAEKPAEETENGDVPDTVFNNTGDDVEDPYSNPTEEEPPPEETTDTEQPKSRTRRTLS